jgi:hypothetical protein
MKRRRNKNFSVCVCEREREREYILKLKTIVKSTKCEKYKSEGEGLNNQQISETLRQVR